MINQVNIEKILDAAIQAPSGDNCQPWEFRTEGDRIHLYNIPAKDTSLYNFQQRASLVAHGAVLENILIASSALGYTAELATFPERAQPDLIATVCLKEAAAHEEPLYKFILQRCTNRKPYDRTSLTSEAKIALLNAAEQSGLGRLRLLEGVEDKVALAEIIGLNDRLVFENSHLHSFLFDHIRWNDEEARQTRNGLDIKTLELAPLDALAFKMFRNYSILQGMNIFGMSKIIAGNAKKLAMSASALGIITVSGNRSVDFLSGGRLLERIWLEATRLGLSLQLMTGISFLMQRMLEGEAGMLSREHVKLIGLAYEKAAELFSFKDETMIIIFRVGYNSSPTARSLRLPVERVVKSF